MPPVRTWMDPIAVCVGRDSKETTVKRVTSHSHYDQYCTYTHTCLCKTLKPTTVVNTKSTKVYSFTILLEDDINYWGMSVSDINECLTLAPCLHGGKCINLMGGYRCECLEGWIGKDCNRGQSSCYYSYCKIAYMYNCV